MSQDPFQNACDQFSNIVDETQFERFRWSRDEAPKLARLVELVKAAFEGREDFDLAEEGTTPEFKRYLIKVHSQRTVAVVIMLRNGRAILGSEAVIRSRFIVDDGDPIATDYENVDEQWVADALKILIGRAHPMEDDAEESDAEIEETEPEVQAANG